MTLDDHANLICTEVSQLELEDIAACKMFLKRGAAVIWQAALWKDSLFEYTQTLTNAAYSPDATWLPTKQVLLVTPQIQQVVAVRSADFKMNVVSSEQLYRVDMDAFQNEGRACRYRLLPPVVWAWDGDIQMSATYDSGAHPEDGAANFSIDYLDAISGNVARKKTTFGGFGGGFLAYVTTSRLDAWIKDVTLGLISMGETGSPVSVSLQASDTQAQKRQQIQFIGVVPDPTTVRVLGKVALPTFEDDNDEFALTGADDCLGAYGQARMLRRERQYGKAEAMKADYLALLKQLIDEQSVQQAFYKRFVPEDGYAWEFSPLQGGWTGDLW